MCDMVTYAEVTELKEARRDEAFKELWFLWERRASVGADFDLFKYQELLHAQKMILSTEEKKNYIYMKKIFALL